MTPDPNNNITVISINNTTNIIPLEQQDDSVIYLIDDLLKDFVYNNSADNTSCSSPDSFQKKMDSFNKESLPKPSSGSIFDMPLEDEKQLINSCKNDSISFNISIVGLKNETCKTVNKLNITLNNTKPLQCNDTGSGLNPNPPNPPDPPIRNNTNDNPPTKECHEENKIIKETKKQLVSMIKEDEKIKRLLLLYYLKRKKNKLNRPCAPPVFKQSEVSK
jgi:hypothetical protein